MNLSINPVNQKNNSIAFGTKVRLIGVNSLEKPLSYENSIQQLPKDIYKGIAEAIKEFNKNGDDNNVTLIYQKGSTNNESCFVFKEAKTCDGQWFPFSNFKNDPEKIPDLLMKAYKGLNSVIDSGQTALKKYFEEK